MFKLEFFFLVEGKTWLSNEWKLCSPLLNNNDVSLLKDWISDVLVNLAMVNYPYPANFLAPLPGNPVKVNAILEDIVSSAMLLYLTEYKYRNIENYYNICIFIFLQEFCKPMQNYTEDDFTLLNSVFKGLNVYFNYTGTSECLNTTSTDSLGIQGWSYQVFIFYIKKILLKINFY